MHGIGGNAKKHGTRPQFSVTILPIDHYYRTGIDNHGEHSHGNTTGIYLLSPL